MNKKINNYLEFIQFRHTVFALPFALSSYILVSEKIGFQMREFGDNTIIIEGVPPDISQGNEDKVVRDVLEFFCEHKTLKSELLDLIAATYSCKAAIKAGDKLEEQEMKVLVDQ